LSVDAQAFAITPSGATPELGITVRLAVGVAVGVEVGVAVGGITGVGVTGGSG
jgi:hypothetical protein